MVFPLHLIFEPKSDPLLFQYGRDRGQCQREIWDMKPPFGNIEAIGSLLVQIDVDDEGGGQV